MHKSPVLQALTQITLLHLAQHVQLVTIVLKTQEKSYLAMLAITPTLAKLLVQVVQMVTIVMNKV